MNSPLLVLLPILFAFCFCYNVYGQVAGKVGLTYVRYMDQDLSKIDQSTWGPGLTSELGYRFDIGSYSLRTLISGPVTQKTDFTFRDKITGESKNGQYIQRTGYFDLTASFRAAIPLGFDSDFCLNWGGGGGVTISNTIFSTKVAAGDNLPDENKSGKSIRGYYYNYGLLLGMEMQIGEGRWFLDFLFISHETPIKDTAPILPETGQVALGFVYPFGKN